ncbi:MAG: hypothetical protein AUK47_08885 [Deltaproteobacteria bacterium CG2_30_63_29]|nr:MAG: hypothetical protein AUK47_08885 [Deltaproteobacteria bacterium CG2_30_63_29]PJB49325.1 MAG: hypothetical protein CO108_00180 [Deltaproteobacteria bacterium CG_4_9_14_3_um_filter_63_12]
MTLSPQPQFDFPVCLQLGGWPVLVVGAGPPVVRRVSALLSAGAKVCVVAPEACPELVALAAQGGVRWEQRAFVPDDLTGVRLVFAATDDREANRQIGAAARDAGVLVNVSDDPKHCEFTMPAVHRRGNLCLAVSTNSTAPAEAIRVRDQLAKLV